MTRPHSGTDSRAGQREVLPTRDQAKRPRHSPGGLPRPALLTYSFCQPPSAPSCAEWTATSRLTLPFPAFFPGIHTDHPQNKQTLGRASPRIPPPPTRAAPAHGPAPTPSGHAPNGTRASAHCSSGSAQSNGKRRGSGRNGKGRENKGASPTREPDWLSIPAETSAPSPSTSRPSAVTTRSWASVVLIVRLELPEPGCREDRKHQKALFSQPGRALGRTSPTLSGLPFCFYLHFYLLSTSCPKTKL